RIRIDEATHPRARRPRHGTAPQRRLLAFLGADGDDGGKYCERLVLYPRLLRKVLRRRRLLRREALWDLHADLDVLIAAAAALLDSLSGYPEFLSVLCAGRDPQHHPLAVQRLYLDL